MVFIRNDAFGAFATMQLNEKATKNRFNEFWSIQS